LLGDVSGRAEKSGVNIVMGWGLLVGFELSMTIQHGTRPT
jgi:hypothetical protein